MTKVWKFVVAVVLVCGLALAGMAIRTQTSAGKDEVKNPNQFRAVWVSTVYRLDYPSKATTDPAVLKADADQILQTCADMGMTAVILQVRPSADALYPSSYYPWSADLTGRQGQAPADGFDPLAYWVEKAHQLGLELHAWINPFRVTKGGQSEYDSLTADHPAKVHPDWVVEYDGKYYFDPGLPEVREYIIQSAEELARNYDIDGIHLDDYFYPGANFDDADTYAQYGSGFSDIGDWRRDNVNQLVKAVYDAIKAAKPEVRFGISPQGNMDNNYNGQYSDVALWMSTPGYVDYILPQLYWGYGYTTSGGQTRFGFENITKEWAALERAEGVALYFGLGAYRIGDGDGGNYDAAVTQWQTGHNLADMIGTGREVGADGYVLYRYDFLFHNGSWADLAASECAAIRAENQVA